MGNRAVVRMTIDDAEHYSVEQRESIIASYPAHEREARAKGIPTLGSGRIYPIAEDEISEPAIQVPKHWACIAGMDFGWDHPTSAVKIAWDREADCVHVVNAYRKSQATPLIHAAALKPWGKKLIFAWPHDGIGHGKDGGRPLSEQYRDEGLEMWQEHATHPTGGYSVEAGIMDILDRMQTGRFKVFSHLHEWFDEFRMYHRKDGKIVKERDDLMDATRMGVMMLRYAEAQRNDYEDPYKSRPASSNSWMVA